jgi:hypothetical protein
LIGTRILTRESSWSVHELGGVAVAFGIGSGWTFGFHTRFV